MNILLYDTGDTRNELNEPLGIEVIAAKILYYFGSSVSVDLYWYNKDGFPSSLDKYDFIGVSININRLEVFDKIYNGIKFMNRRPILIAGNVIATYGYIQLLKLYPEILCIIGEGEETFVEILKYNVRNNFEKYIDVPNLAFLKNGDVYTTERKCCDLDKYIPPLRTFAEYLLNNNGVVRVEASRGCSWNRCNFCSVSYKYKRSKWRTIPIQSVTNQLIELSNLGFKSIYFTDEDFIGDNLDRFAMLVESIANLKNEGLIANEMNFFISIKPIDVENDKKFEVLKKFHNVGLREVFVGLESGSTQQLKRYNKCTNKLINTNIMARLRDEEFSIDIGLILFDPKLSFDELVENIDFIEQNRLFELDANIIKRLRLQPFTKMKEDSCIKVSENFDIDNLTYSYCFDNEIIKDIYLAFKNLNMDKYAYTLQCKARGEISSEEMRNEIKQRLIGIRGLQFKALRVIVDYYKKSSSYNDYKLKISQIENESKQMSNITEILSKIRN